MRLNGVGVYFDVEDYPLLLNKLTTLFGKYTQLENNKTAMQWVSGDFTLVLVFVNAGLSTNAVLSISYNGLKKPKLVKKSWGLINPRTVKLYKGNCMKILNLALFGASVFLLNACAYNVNVGSKEAAAKGITYNYDKFKSEGWLRSEVYVGGMSEPVTNYNYRASTEKIQVHLTSFNYTERCFHKMAGVL